MSKQLGCTPRQRAAHWVPQHCSYMRGFPQSLLNLLTSSGLCGESRDTKSGSITASEQPGVRPWHVSHYFHVKRHDSGSGSRVLAAVVAWWWQSCLRHTWTCLLPVGSDSHRVEQPQCTPKPDCYASKSSALKFQNCTNAHQTFSQTILPWKSGRHRVRDILQGLHGEWEQPPWRTSATMDSWGPW